MICVSTHIWKVFWFELIGSESSNHNWKENKTCLHKPSNVANEFSFWRYWCVASSAILNFKLVSLKGEEKKKKKEWSEQISVFKKETRKIVQNNIRQTRKWKRNNSFFFSIFKLSVHLGTSGLDEVIPWTRKSSWPGKCWPLCCSWAIWAGQRHPGASYLPSYKLNSYHQPGQSNFCLKT